MGENEQSSVIRMIIAIGVFAAFTVFFASIVYVLISKSVNVHKNNYGVN